jgi:hypothetical protein
VPGAPEVLLDGERERAAAEESSSARERSPGGWDGFAGSAELFDGELVWLAGEEAAGLSHGELEDRMLINSRDLYRQLLDEHLELRAEREARISEVRDADGERRGNVEGSHERPLASVFGEVSVRRLAYRARGRCNLYPSDGALN